MIVTVTIDNVERFVPGPPDLAHYTGGKLRVYETPSEMDKSTWGFAIGMFVLRGGSA